MNSIILSQSRDLIHRWQSMWREHYRDSIIANHSSRGHVASGDCLLDGISFLLGYFCSHLRLLPASIHSLELWTGQGENWTIRWRRQANFVIFLSHSYFKQWCIFGWYNVLPIWFHQKIELSPSNIWWSMTHFQYTF